MSEIWQVYILRCGDGTYYTGIAKDLSHRVEQHTQGKGAKYTRGRGPLTLMYTEVALNRSSALARERAIKQLSRQQKENLIERGCFFVGS